MEKQEWNWARDALSLLERVELRGREAPMCTEIQKILAQLADGSFVTMPAERLRAMLDAQSTEKPADA